MSNDEEKKNLRFNIYYLNFSKVYEISLMINNVFKSNIWKEKTDSNETSKTSGALLSARLGFKNITPNIESKFSDESTSKNVSTSKLIESLNVIPTKSLLLRDIICKCKVFEKFDDCEEGDLLKIDKLSLSILDEDLLRPMIMLRKNALKGFEAEGFEVNNFISSMLEDYSYILKGFIDDKELEEDDNTEDDKEPNDAVILKIPSEIENEFESKYNVYDLLIGHLSVIGVYKGKVTEDFIKTNTFNYFANMEAQKQFIGNGRVIQSSNHNNDATVEEKSQPSDSENTTFHFIDIIALIQDVQFDEKVEIEENVEPSKLRKLLNYFMRRG
jgi:hypothetical protein